MRLSFMNKSWAGASFYACPSHGANRLNACYHPVRPSVFTCSIGKMEDSEDHAEDRLRKQEINPGGRMIRFITILIGCSLALTAGVRAEQEDPKKKQKSKPVQKQQSSRPSSSNDAEHPCQRTHQQPQHQQPQHQQPQQQSPTAARSDQYACPRSAHAACPNPYNPKIQSNDLSKQQVHKPPSGSVEQAASRFRRTSCPRFRRTGCPGCRRTSKQCREFNLST